MVVPVRALDQEMLGAWLVKSSGAEPSTRAHLRDGFTGVSTWCVRPTYRTGLVVESQLVLLWVSGTERDHPAGIYARGLTTGPVEAGVMPLVLTGLVEPLLRSEVVDDPVLRTMEVLRMPAGSNPSYVTPQHLEALRELCSELRGAR